jgi:hypothetical protein
MSLFQKLWVIFYLFIYLFIYFLIDGLLVNTTEWQFSANWNYAIFICN